MRIKYGFILAMVFMALLSCEESFFPEIDQADNLLVIDGKITDAPGPYTIRLNISSDVYQFNYPPLTGASLTITDDLGESEVLTEEEPGVYRTALNGLQGTVGRSYKIDIATKEGKNYMSEFEEITPSAPIRNVSAEIETHFDPSLAHDRIGYQFYLDGDAPTQQENYYLYELEATYKYKTDFLIEFIFQNFSFIKWDAPDTFHVCYKTFTVQELVTLSTKNLENPQINRLPLHFEDTEDRLLAIRYSLNAKQFSLTEKAYKYWRSIDEQISEQGNLYSRQPYQIRGNLTNVADPDEPVLGYFTAAGVSEKRIFVSRPEDIPFYFEKCVLITERLFFVLANGDFVGLNDQGQRGAGSGGFCLDCRDIGGGIVKPDFWID